MIFHKTLVNIRKKHGLCRAKLAQALGCTEDYIAALEDNKDQATFNFVIKIKETFDLHTAPIFESERNTLMEDLLNWKRAIDYADLDTATKLKPELEASVRLSFSPSTEIFYELYAADYYYIKGDTTAYDEAMAALSTRVDEFGKRHHYQYYRLLGAKAFVEKRYQDAIKAYKMAEKLDKDGSWHDVRFYAGLGASLSDRGYATRAIDYMERAKHIARYDKAYRGRSNRRFDVYIDGYLASDLSKVGRSEEALRILEKRLAQEKKINSRVGIGYTYFSFGRAYKKINNNEKVIEYCDKAFECLNTSDQSYIDCLYYKASALTATGSIAGAVECAEEGLKIATDESRKAIFDAIKHTALISGSRQSAIYLKEVVIPKLHEYGQYEIAVYCYQQLSGFYHDEGYTDKALEYKSLALETHKKFHKTLVEGDM